MRALLNQATSSAALIKDLTDPRIICEDSRADVLSSFGTWSDESESDVELHKRNCPFHHLMMSICTSLNVIGQKTFGDVQIDIIR
jgi:hypothetical protein